MPDLVAALCFFNAVNALGGYLGWKLTPRWPRLTGLLLVAFTLFCQLTLTISLAVIVQTAASPPTESTLLKGGRPRFGYSCRKTTRICRV